MVIASAEGDKVRGSLVTVRDFMAMKRSSDKKGESVVSTN